jgi:hypothetical protein
LTIDRLQALCRATTLIVIIASTKRTLIFCERLLIGSISIDAQSGIAQIGGVTHTKPVIIDVNLSLAITTAAIHICTGATLALEIDEWLLRSERIRAAHACPAAPQEIMTETFILTHDLFMGC